MLAFAGAMTVASSDANAAVCADRLVRDGCPEARGAVVVRKTAVVVRKPAVVCRSVVVNGVKVRRCT